MWARACRVLSLGTWRVQAPPARKQLFTAYILFSFFLAPSSLSGKSHCGELVAFNMLAPVASAPGAAARPDRQDFHQSRLSIERLAISSITLRPGTDDWFGSLRPKASDDQLDPLTIVRAQLT